MTTEVKWSAGWNLPGCLPEMEPAVFDTKEDAEQFIADEIEFVSGEDLLPDDPYVYWVEPIYSELESQ
jgi:hypothetical protein